MKHQLLYSVRWGQAGMGTGHGVWGDQQGRGAGQGAAVHPKAGAGPGRQLQLLGRR